MSLDSDAIVPWLVFDITGQWCLLALLVTYAAAEHLPQRRNPFLINFILATFLSTIPPALLLYTGNQYGKASNGLCFAQAALVDGVAPMFGMAQLLLVFDTWFELRIFRVDKPNPVRRPIIKYTLLMVPYLTLWIWTFSSFVAAAKSKASRYDGYVYCVMSSRPSEQLRNFVGWFMALLGLVELILELWICWMMYNYRSKNQASPLAWRTTVHFTSRLLGLSSVQLIAVILALLNIKFNSIRIKFAYDLMDSTNALVTFLAFGTQRDLFKTWGAWGRGKRPSYESELPGHLFLESSDLHPSKALQFEEDLSDDEEKGKSRL